MKRFIVVCLEKNIIPSYRIIYEFESQKDDLAIIEFVNFCETNLKNLGYIFVDKNSIENDFSFLGSGYYLLSAKFEIIDYLPKEKPYTQISYDGKEYRLDSKAN